MSDDADTGGEGLTLADERGAAFMLGAGFFCFGLAAGAITGASSAEAISNSLLGSLFTFVGGTALGFAGFRRRNPGKGVAISGRRVGAATAAFSLGILLGLAGGIGARWTFEHREADAGGEVGPAARGGEDGGRGAKGAFVLLHGSEVEALRDIRDKLDTHGFDGPEGCKDAVERLRVLAESAREP